MCIKCALPYLSPYVTSNAFLQYLALQVLPVLDNVAAAAGPEAQGIDLEVLQLVAELTPSVTPTSVAHPIDVAACQVEIFSKLLQYLTLPPEDLEGAGDAVEPNLQFTHIESLLFAFHQLGKHNADVLSDDAKLKDLKLRLQYLARGVQNYTKKLKESLSGLKKAALQEEENLIKAVALKSTTNINTIIKDLFHIPPSFKTSVALSWTKPASKTPVKLGVSITPSVAAKEPAATPDAENGAAVVGKRKAIEAPEGSAPKVDKKERQIYAPPSGKFSGNNRGNYNKPVRGRGGFGGRGRGRGNRFAKRYSQ